MVEQRRIWTFGLMAFAMILMVPTFWFSGLSQASHEDWDVAATPVARVPLDSLQRTRSVSLVFRVPAEEQWTRIRETWGDPDYVIFAREPDPSRAVVSWNALGIQVVGSTGLGPLTMAPAGAINNTTRSDDTGLSFRAKPGERVRLDLTVSASVTLPAGELTIAPNWKGDGEGRAWGMAFALNYRRSLRLAFFMGVGLLVAGAIVGSWRTA
jgi:hypothetical protein